MSDVTVISAATAVDLNKLLMPIPCACYLMRVGSTAMEPQIFQGDVVVVDKTRAAEPGRVVIAIVDGEFTIRRLVLSVEALVLQAENPEFDVVAVTPAIDFWGVVTWSIHQLRQHARIQRKPKQPDTHHRPPADVAVPQRGLPCDADVLDEQGPHRPNVHQTWSRANHR